MNIQIEDALCFNLYSASRAMTQVYAPYLKKIDLTYPQFLVMVLLWSKDNVSVKELGERLYLDSGTLTPLLKRMESTGLISRTRSKEDERAVLVALTKKGKALEKKSEKVPMQMFCHLKLDEKQFHETLGKVREVLLNLREELDA